MVTRWTTPADVQARLRRRWDSGELLTVYVSGQWEPIVVPLRAPTPAELAEDFGAAQSWLAAWKKVDPAVVRLEWKRIGGRLVGSNEVPHRAVLHDPRQVWTMLRVKQQVETFTRLLDATRAAVPALAAWMTAAPMKALAYDQDWLRLVEVVLWIERHSTSDRYLRHIDVPGVDTKFIENHRTVLAELLDRQLPPERIDRTQPPKRFAERYGFRTKPVYVRLRTLGTPVPPAFGPFREVAVRVDELTTVALDAVRVLIVENETTYLALPTMPGTVAVLGGGYAVPVLAPLTWLHDRDVVYWGDIDTHGFAILDRLRTVFPHVVSVLMDEETLLRHRPHWGREPSPDTSELAHLTMGEAQVYEALVDGRYGPALRLEQERISFAEVERHLLSLG